MIEMYRYSEKEVKDILSTLTILVDTREQDNAHITDYLDKKKIKYKSKKLDFADYSCFIPKNEQYGIVRDIYFTDMISIERKGSLEELSTNLTKERERIEGEFKRSKGRVHLMIEGATYGDILRGNYNTDYKKHSFIATLRMWENRYGFGTMYIDRSDAGAWVAQTLAYFVKEYLTH